MSYKIKLPPSYEKLRPYVEFIGMLEEKGEFNGTARYDPPDNVDILTYTKEEFDEIVLKLQVHFNIDKNEVTKNLLNVIPVKDLNNIIISYLWPKFTFIMCDL